MGERLVPSSDAKVGTGRFDRGLHLLIAGLCVGRKVQDVGYASALSGCTGWESLTFPAAVALDVTSTLKAASLAIKYPVPYHSYAGSLLVPRFSATQGPKTRAFPLLSIPRCLYDRPTCTMFEPYQSSPAYFDLPSTRFLLDFSFLSLPSHGPRAPLPTTCYFTDCYWHT